MFARLRRKLALAWAWRLGHFAITTIADVVNAAINAKAKGFVKIVDFACYKANGSLFYRPNPVAIHATQELEVILIIPEAAKELVDRRPSIARELGLKI